MLINKIRISPMMLVTSTSAMAVTICKLTIRAKRIRTGRRSPSATSGTTYAIPAVFWEFRLHGTDGWTVAEGDFARIIQEQLGGELAVAAAGGDGSE